MNSCNCIRMLQSNQMLNSNVSWHGINDGTNFRSFGAGVKELNSIEIKTCLVSFSYIEKVTRSFPFLKHMSWILKITKLYLLVGKYRQAGGLQGLHYRMLRNLLEQKKLRKISTRELSAWFTDYWLWRWMMMRFQTCEAATENMSISVFLEWFNWARKRS